MSPSLKSLCLAGLTAFLLVLPPLYALNAMRNHSGDDPVQALTQYLGYLYARDFHHAYHYISSEDQRLKKINTYVRERGAFNGFALEAARKLSELIKVRPVAQRPDGTRYRIRLAMTLPDASGVASLLLDWDEKRLNALSAPERRQILASIDSLARSKKLPMIQGEEEYVLVKEGSYWKVFLNWAAGVRVTFRASLPPESMITAEPTTKGTVARSGDLFTMGFKVKNRTNKEIVTRIVHRVDPRELAQYLDLVECALLLPVRILPGEEQTYNSTYLVRTDLPDGIKNINVTYEFKVAR
jgi:hypothetical protein